MIPIQRSQPLHLVLVVLAYVGCAYAFGTTILIVGVQSMGSAQSVLPLLFALGFGITLVAVAWARNRPAFISVSYSIMLSVYVAMTVLSLRTEPGPILVVLLWGPFLLGLPLWISSLSVTIESLRKRAPSLGER